MQGHVRQKEKAKRKVKAKETLPTAKVGSKEKAKGKKRVSKGKEKGRLSKKGDKEKAKDHSMEAAIRVADHTSAEIVQRE